MQASSSHASMDVVHSRSLGVTAGARLSHQRKITHHSYTLYSSISIACLTPILCPGASERRNLLVFLDTRFSYSGVFRGASRLLCISRQYHIRYVALFLSITPFATTMCAGALEFLSIFILVGFFWPGCFAALSGMRDALGDLMYVRIGSL